MYTNDMAELPMECAIAVWQLLGNDVLERRRTKSGSFGYQTQLYEESISFLICACLLPVEKLFKDLQEFKRTVP